MIFRNKKKPVDTTPLSDDEKRRYIKIHQKDGRLFEDIISLIYRDVCDTGDTVVDGGSNHGHHTFQFADTVGTSGSVIAIEAVPALCEEVRIEAARSGRPQVISVCGALSSSHGVAEFFFRHQVDGWSSLFSVHQPPNRNDEDTSRLIVPLIMLDDLVDIATSCRFMKLDLELNEFSALLGGERFLATHRPIVVFENARQHAARIAGYSAEAFFSYFSRSRYALYDIFLSEFTSERWMEASTVPVYTIALPEEERDLVQRFTIRQMLDSCLK